MVAVKRRGFSPGIVTYYRIIQDSPAEVRAEFYLESPGHTGPFPHGLNVEPD